MLHRPWGAAADPGCWDGAQGQITASTSSSPAQQPALRAPPQQAAEPRMRRHPAARRAPHRAQLGCAGPRAPGGGASLRCLRGGCADFLTHSKGPLEFKLYTVPRDAQRETPKQIRTDKPFYQRHRRGPSGCHPHRTLSHRWTNLKCGVKEKKNYNKERKLRTRKRMT